MQSFSPLCLACIAASYRILCKRSGPVNRAWPTVKAEDVTDPRWRAIFLGKHKKILTFPHSSMWMRSPGGARKSYTAECCAILAKIANVKGDNDLVARMIELSEAWMRVGWRFINWKRFTGRHGWAWQGHLRVIPLPIDCCRICPCKAFRCAVKFRGCV